MIPARSAPTTRHRTGRTAWLGSGGRSPLLNVEHGCSGRVRKGNLDEVQPQRVRIVRGDWNNDYIDELCDSSKGR